MTDRAELWSGLIDYAGVFPPAELPLGEALKTYERAAAGPDGWLLGPCLIRSSQLVEVDPASAPSQLGLVLDEKPAEDPAMPVAQTETKAAPGAVAAAASVALGSSGIVYVESTGTADQSFLGEIASLRAEGRDVRAKIRTGGTSATSFPSIEEVGSFVQMCTAAAIPFKATAGLHHPIRTTSDVEGAIEHGFINVLAAVRAALAGDQDACLRSLASGDPADFDVTAAVWRGVGAEVPASRVRQAFRSFGSCSFHEPTGYLRELGVLPLEVAR